MAVVAKARGAMTVVAIGDDCLVEFDHDATARAPVAVDDDDDHGSDDDDDGSDEPRSL